ncbi:MAG: nicotinamide mononucleotide transporter [Bacteroidales bacterium]|nr:nicotinamide mononucleotide transporter [Bacteroidales bacterium]
MDNNKFNKYFSAFVLIGMAVATIVATATRFGSAETQERMLLVISALGSLMGVAAAVTSANGLAATFIFGMFNVSIYASVCLYNWYHGGSGLGHALLHFLYMLPMQVVGLMQWRKRGQNESGGVKARRLSPGRRWMVAGLYVAASVVVYFILARFDRSAADTFIKTAVVLDVLPIMCNIIGQLLMSTAYIEQWVFWIGVNIFSLVMWSNALAQSPGSSYAVIYIIKYGFYLINSINGLRNWIIFSRPAKETV